MDEDATWYGSRPRRRPHCTRRVPSAPRKGHSTPPPLLGPCLLWPRSPISATAELLLHCLRQKLPMLYNGRRYPPELPWGIWTSHVTRDAFGSCESTTQTAPRSVQPYLHRWSRSVSILYNGLPVFPLRMLASGPHLIRGSLGPPESETKMVT